MKYKLIDKYFPLAVVLLIWCFAWWLDPLEYVSKNPFWAPFFSFAAAMMSLIQSGYGLNRDNKELYYSIDKLYKDAVDLSNDIDNITKPIPTVTSEDKNFEPN
jgi:hypothetical protein